MKSEWYTISRATRDGDHILSMRDPELRRERKKYIIPAVRNSCSSHDLTLLPSLTILSPAQYSARGIDDFEEGTNRALLAWIDLIERKYLSTPGKFVPMNLAEKTHFYTLDAVGEIAYSESFECLKQDRDTKGVLAVNSGSVPILMAVGTYVLAWRLMRVWPFYLLLPHDGDECGFGAIIG